MKRSLLAFVFAAGAALTLATTANAVPSIGANKDTLQNAASSGAVERVHYRKWRHSHRRKFRHGHYYRDYGYRRGPSIYLNFGGSRYGHRRHRQYYGDYYGDRGYW